MASFPIGHVTVAAWLLCLIYYANPSQGSKTRRVAGVGLSPDEGWPMGMAMGMGMVLGTVSFIPWLIVRWSGQRVQVLQQLCRNNHRCVATMAAICSICTLAFAQAQ